MDEAINWFGKAVMVLAGLKLLVVLIVDTANVIASAFKKPGAVGMTGFGGLLEKLPERYLTSIVAFLFGLLLANPVAFAAIWGQASK